MRSFLMKTFGGLTPSYFFRHLFFGSLIFAVVVAILAAGGPLLERLELLALFVLFTALYPCSRFVYESVMRCVIGGNVFTFNAIFFVSSKIFSMVMCWSFSLVIAPVGLVFLYVHHSRRSTDVIKGA